MTFIDRFSCHPLQRVHFFMYFMLACIPVHMDALWPHSNSPLQEDPCTLTPSMWAPSNTPTIMHWSESMWPSLTSNMNCFLCT